MKTNTLNYARITGLALLLMALVAGFAYGYAMNEIYVADDAASTLNNYLQKSTLYQMMCWAFIIILALDVLVSFTLCYWLHQEKPLLVKTMSGIRLLYSAILALAVYSLFQAYTPNMDTNAVSIQSSFEKFNNYFSFGLIIFGIHLAMLGAILWMRAGIPKIFGILGLFAGICYTLIHLLHLSWPEFALYRTGIENVLALPMASGELALAFWMLIKGKRLSDFSGLGHSSFDAA